MSKATVKALSQVSVEDLKSLLALPSCYYFLYWPEQVSGFISQLPTNFPSPKGQAFNHHTEIRWQQQGDRYNVLWLGIEEAPAGFEAIPGEWIYTDHDAQVYPPTETRLPQGIKPLPPNLDVGQRYFCDRRTATIHFIALRIK